MKKIILSSLLVLSGILSAFAAGPVDRNPLKGSLSPNLKCTGEKYETGTVVPYSYYLSPLAKQDSCAVYVLLEMDKSFSSVLEPMFQEKLIPEGIVIYVNPGTLEYQGDKDRSRWLRAEEFDQNGPEFCNLIIEEMIPAAVRDAGVVISKDPDKHFIHGGSSGGYLCWNALWYRNDFFHRGFLSSPTFSAMRGGEEPMVLVRKTEPRPIRAFITAGTVEPDYFFGDSFYAACNAADALEFAGYDVRFEIYAQGTHSYNRSDPDTWRRMMEWVFAPDKVTVPRRCVRFASIVPENSSWQMVSEVETPSHLSLKAGGVSYEVRKGKLKVKSPSRKAFVGKELQNISSIAFSSDMWRLYVADASRRFIYACTLDTLGVPCSMYKLAPLHLAHDCKTIGGLDICVSSDDRVFVATELGVQSICSFGLTDIILPLPGDVPAIRVWMVEDWLYAESSEGSVYRRQLNVSAHDGESPSTPSDRGYNDKFNYSRPHFKEMFNKYSKGEVLLEY